MYFVFILVLHLYCQKRQTYYQCKGQHLCTEDYLNSCVGCYGTADVPRTADGIAINKTELKTHGLALCVKI